MIDHFIATLPKRPYCGKTGAFLIRDRDQALKFPLIQFNHPNFRQWIGIDVDIPFADSNALNQSSAAITWEDCGLEPNLIMQNPENGHCHFLYGLEKPIVVPNGPQTKAVKYLSAVTRGLTKALKGDYSYSGLLVKNPTHEEWRTLLGRRKLYSLDDIRPHVELNVAVDKIAADTLGRNDALFQTLRFWAYREFHSLRRHNALTHLLFHSLCDEQARVINATFTYPLPESEIRSTAKSVANYCLNKYRGTRPNAGMMNLDKSLPLPQRQAIAAKHTNRKRVSGTRAKMATTMLAIGLEKCTWSAVAEKSGLSIRTVGTYFNEVMGELLDERSRMAAPIRAAA